MKESLKDVKEAAAEILNWLAHLALASFLVVALAALVATLTTFLLQQWRL